MPVAVVGLPVAVGISSDRSSIASDATTCLASDRSTAYDTCEKPKTLSKTAAAAVLQQNDSQWASGLCHTTAESVQAHPLRIVILDNSGSMRAADGKKLVFHGGSYKSIGCSRWQELVADVRGIAMMSDVLGARTDLHLLNPVPSFNALSLKTDAYDGGIAPVGRTVDVPELERLLDRINPGGTTPLTESVMSIVSMITPMAPRLRASGQSVAVLICTDGMPNDKNSFVQAMRVLQTLPVWCVVRLCTDEDAVVDFWNDLDRQLEAPLEVLDDVHGEASEVYTFNSWLTYAPPLHMARLFGLHEKLFDALDEQALMPSQIRTFIQLLFGLSDLPEPELDRPGFVEAVRQALQEQPLAYDSRSRRMKPWIDLRKLEHALTPGVRCGKDAGGCMIM